MRIITGIYKGRHFDIPRSFKARPTTDFAKENIRECMKKISADRDNILIRGDVFRFIRTCKQQFDLIFADPPYALPELPTIPNLILEKKMLKPGGLLVFEHGKKNDFSSVPGFIEHRAYGSVNFSLFRTPEEEF